MPWNEESKRSTSETPHGTTGARLFTRHQASPAADLEAGLRFYDGVQVFAEVEAPRQRNILSVNVKSDLIHAFARNVCRLAIVRYPHQNICVAMDLDAGSDRYRGTSASSQHFVVTSVAR